MTPPAMFGSRAFVGLTVTTFLLYGALGGLPVLLPFVLMTTAAYTPFQAGLALLPFPALIGGASRAMGRVAASTGPRWPLTLGPLIVAAGFGLMTVLDLHDRYWTNVLPPLLIVAVGMTGAVAPLTTAVLGAVDERHTGTASGLNSAVARAGGLIATAAAGAAIAARGGALIAAFQASALLAAVLSALAGVTAWLTLGKQ